MWVPESLFEIKGTKDAMVEAPKRARINVLKQVSKFLVAITHCFSLF